MDRGGSDNWNEQTVWKAVENLEKVYSAVLACNGEYCGKCIAKVGSKMDNGYCWIACLNIIIKYYLNIICFNMFKNSFVHIKLISMAQ